MRIHAKGEVFSSNPVKQRNAENVPVPYRTFLSQGTKHTKLILRIHIVGMGVVMMHLRCICHAHIWGWGRPLLLLHLRWNGICGNAVRWHAGWRKATRWLRSASITWTCHMICMRARILVAGIGLVHPSHASASQFGVRVAVSPAVNRPLYQTPFPTQARIQLSQ